MIVLFNQEQKKLENELKNGIKNGQFRVFTKTRLSNSEIMTVFKICMGEYPECVNIDNCNLSFQMGLGFKYIEFQKHNKSHGVILNERDVLFLRKKAEEIVNSLQLKNKNDMVKAVGIYDYLWKTVKYQTSDNSQNAWGALVDKKAVCEGIAYAFSLLAKTSGLDCTVVTGTMNNGAHAWNMVKIDNCFYHIDVTSALEDNVSSCTCNYDFIFLQDSDMKGYSWDTDLYPPCRSNIHNYFVYTRSYARTRKEAEEIIRRQVSSKRIVYFRADPSLNLTEDSAYELFLKSIRGKSFFMRSATIRVNPNMNIVQIKYSGF